MSVSTPALMKECYASIAQLAEHPFSKTGPQGPWFESRNGLIKGLGVGG